MSLVEIGGVEGMKSLVGREVGPSEWRTVTQDDINSFAQLSGDHQWIHVDAERAKTESPYGTTIAHGNLDFVTSPRASRRFAKRAKAAGARVDYRVVHGDSHAMLLRPGRWHRLTTRSTLEFLGM